MSELDVHADLIVASHPVLGVEPAHLAEARRALRAQGRTVDDAGVLRLLWAARALPAALDVLADARNDRALDSLVLRRPVVELGAPASDGGLLWAVARREPTAVVVELLERRALFAPEADLPACCTVLFPIATVDDDVVAVHRFTVGPS